MRFALAVLMVLHGVAHLPGFLSSWRLAKLEDVPYHTTVLAGRFEVGDAGMRVLGALWLAVAVSFVATGVLAGAGWARWIPAAAAVASASLLLTLLESPYARIGLAVNLVLLAALALASRLGAL